MEGFLLYHHHNDEEKRWLAQLIMPPHCDTISQNCFPENIAGLQIYGGYGYMIDPEKQSYFRVSCHRAGGRGSGGCVFGSKNLKAIAARGTKGLSIYDPRALFKAMQEFRKYKE